jgi:hypothetical protein
VFITGERNPFLDLCVGKGRFSRPPSKMTRNPPERICQPPGRGLKELLKHPFLTGEFLSKRLQ